MGKSPGKWIKTAFFGKKSSKSGISKKAVLQEEAIDKLSDDPAENPSVISDQPPDTSDKSGENSEPEMGISENIPHNGVVSLPGTQDANREGTLEWDSLDSDQIVVLEQAAMKAQAAFRGYLARRAFHALKGIIVLQAVIRGDLVRRQAIANLLCTPGQLVSCQTELVPEQSQNEIERVRRNLKKVKVSGSSTEAPRKSETKTFRQKPSPRKVSGSPVADVPQKGVHGSTEKKSSAVVSALKVSEQPEIQTTPNSYIAEKTLDVDGDHLGVELHPPENGHEVEKGPMVDEELNFKEDNQNNKENQRIRRRRSFLVKKGFGENASDNSPTLPSYMAATESAKAKLNSQGSPRFGQDADENGLYRQPSFPSSTNGRLSSSMPSQTQKLAQENGKGGNKNFKSKLSSRDGHEKVVQPGWKR